MAREGPYEIVPTEEIRDLKVEIGELKKKSERFGSESLVESLSQLTKNMSEMMQVFKLAAEQIKAEESGDGGFKRISEKLDKIIEQNQTIAEALVSMNDMITTDVDKLLHRIEQTEKTIGMPKKKEMKMPEMPMPQQMQPQFMPPPMPPRGMKQPMPSPMPYPMQFPQAPTVESAPKIDISDLENLPEMPPLELEEPKEKKGIISKLFHKK
ncbi:MAG TPA: hypothetical protein VJI46_05100 [Candidatus Nanoarchaeia archaeon]|nr:hypothetical protein [Candidatus Nanoarchaeia archaeon]